MTEIELQDLCRNDELVMQKVADLVEYGIRLGQGRLKDEGDISVVDPIESSVYRPTNHLSIVIVHDRELYLHAKQKGGSAKIYVSPDMATQIAKAVASWDQREAAKKWGRA